MPKYRTGRHASKLKRNYPLTKVKIKHPYAENFLIIEALLDTGSAYSMFRSEPILEYFHANDLLLDKKYIKKIDGDNVCLKHKVFALDLDLYYGQFSLLNSRIVFAEEGSEIPNLIGRDLLDNMHLYFDGSNRRWGLND